MRVLHINCNYTGTTLHQLMVEKLDSLDIENEVFVPTYDKNSAVIDVNDNVFVSECFKKIDRYFFDYKQSKIIKAIEARYDVQTFDLIHAYTLFTDGNAARVLSEKYGIPYVVAVRNTDVNDFFAKRILLRQRGIKNMMSANKVFFLSDSYKNQVFEKYISAKLRETIGKKVLIIPNGIDSFWFDNKCTVDKSANETDVKLIYAGGIDRNKNITETQKAMSILRNRGIHAHLTVVGKIKQQEEYKKVMSDKYTDYIPEQPKEKLIQIYRGSDIFVMPSIHESFGLVYAEAMSQGLPVIYSKGQGFDRQFSDGTVGYSVNCHSDVDIADRIIKILCNYHEISDNCKKCADKFRWDVIAQKYRDIYFDIK